jgi:hypothetical protein
MDRPATDVVRDRSPSLIFWVSDLPTTFVSTVRCEMRSLREDEYVSGAVKEARQRAGIEYWKWRKRRDEECIGQCENLTFNSIYSGKTPEKLVAAWRVSASIKRSEERRGDSETWWV